MNPESQAPDPSQPPVQQPPAPAAYTPQPQPAVPQPPFMSPDVPPTPAPQSPKGSRSKMFLIGALLVLIIAGGATYAVSRHSKDQNTDLGGSASLDGSPATVSTCAPIIASTLDATSAQTTYERFAKAIADKNQTCADGLSTSFFLTFAKQEFGASDGKWITAKVAGHESMADDFSQLPTTLDTTKFSQIDYTRGTVVGSANQTPATGTTLNYPIDISKFTGDSSVKNQASISMVLDNGNIKVDALEIGIVQAPLTH